MFEDVFMKVAHEETLAAEIRNLAQKRGETSSDVISDLRGKILDSQGLLRPEVSKSIDKYEPMLERYNDALSNFLRSRSADYVRLEAVLDGLLTDLDEAQREIDEMRVTKEEVKARWVIDPPPSGRSWLTRILLLKREENHLDRIDHEYQLALSRAQEKRRGVADVATAMKRIELARWEQWTESALAIELDAEIRAKLNPSIADQIRIHATSWVSQASLADEVEASLADSASINWAGEVVIASSETSHENSGVRKDVFLVHGQDEDLASDMRAFLRALGLRPIEWSQAKSSLKQGSPYIGDIVLAGVKMSDAVLILLTPDELVDLRPELVKETAIGPGVDYQARPNVYYEAGIADALDRDHTIIVEVGKVRPFTDASGRHVVRFNGSQQARLDLRDALRSVDLSVDDSGRDWIHVGHFIEMPAT